MNASSTAAAAPFASAHSNPMETPSPVEAAKLDAASSPTMARAEDSSCPQVAPPERIEISSDDDEEEEVRERPTLLLQKKRRRRIALEDDEEESSEQGTSAASATSHAVAAESSPAAAASVASASEATAVAEDELPPRKRKKKRPAAAGRPSAASALPAAPAGLSSVDAEVDALRVLNARERASRSACVPSLTAGVSAERWDARELLAGAMSAALRDAADETGEAAMEATTNEQQRRRETNDTFLERLAAKYAKPTKASKAKSASAAADSNAGSETGKPQKKPRAKKLKPLDAAAAEATAANPSVAAALDARPDDMHFLMFQEEIGLQPPRRR
jgi:hypothetical protein